MATVVANMSMSLDGFVADVNDGVEHLFGWYFGGDVDVPTADERLTFKVSEASARELRGGFSNVGALLTGRRNFENAKGWGGHHPVGAPVFIVTHTPPEGWDDAPFTFVTDGVESAVAQAKATAGDRFVAVDGASIVQQCINLGLMDVIRVDLVPVLLGAGIPFFANLEHAPVTLDNPRVVEGVGVTHLEYRVKKD
jgi:dihydrofolate reductase